jgi:hypothetical protein
MPLFGILNAYFALQTPLFGIKKAKVFFVNLEIENTGVWHLNTKC